MLNSFYFDQLTASQRAIYEKLEAAVEGFRESVYLDSVNVEDIRTAVESYLCDHPQSYHCALNFYSVQPSSTSSRLFLQYFDTDDGRFETELEKLEADITKRLAGKSGDFEKCKTVYDCLVTIATSAPEVENEYYAIDRQNASEVEDFIARRGLVFGAYGPIVEKKGTCMGFALAYKLILDRMGVECACVPAAIEDSCRGAVPHMFNVVEVDGYRAFVDLTRGVPVPGLSMIRYDYFLVSRNAVESYCSLEGNWEWECEHEHVSYFARMRVRFNGLRALRSYLYGVSYRATDGEIRFQYVGNQVGDDYLERMLGNIVHDRCGTEYRIEGYLVENGIGNCRVMRA